MAVKTISVVAPVFQESDILPLFIRELLRVIGTLGDYQWEIILVDDGSEDQTLDQLKQARAGDSRIKWISLSRNFGHQAALTAGLERACGDAVIMMDSDLQHPVDLLPTLIEKWGSGFDLVLTVRDDDPDLGLVKRATSHGFYRIMKLMSRVPILESGADFRLMSRKALQAFLRFGEAHRFIRGMIAWMGFSVAEVRFRPGQRMKGRSKYSMGHMMYLALDGLTSFSVVPLRLITLVGLCMCGLTIAYSGYALFIWLFHPDRLRAGWTSLLISVNLLGGIILLALGIIGEYVGRVFEQVKGRPIYLIKDEGGFE